jgi:membrane-associated phospholipid phosphatase
MSALRPHSRRGFPALAPSTANSAGYGAARCMIKGAVDLAATVTTTQLTPPQSAKRDRRLTPHRPTKWWVVLVGYLLALAFGAAYALFIKSYGDWDVGAGWEQSLMLDIHGHELSSAMEIMLHLAPWLGTNYTLFPICASIALYLWFRRKRRDLAIWLMVAELGCLSHNWILKHLFMRERPELFERVGWYGWASYPSGHAMAAIAILGTMALMLERERGWRWPLLAVLVVALLNFYGRIYHGVHWPSDVLAGAVVGLVWLLGTAIGFDGLPKRRRSDRPQSQQSSVRDA